mmetsp:Transcript_1153/g.1151  ORF Transcript_1153/g.1151 Transcript_1153/m.1151 type:complete len:107 (-) Transcript_1153:83-403(-)
MFVEKHFNSILSFARFSRKGYYRDHILPLVAKTQMDEDDEIDKNEEIVKMNKSVIRKKEYKYELEETNSVNEFLREADEPSFSSHLPAIELVSVDLEIKYNYLLKN